MNVVRLERDGKGPLEFVGEQIAHVSTYQHGKDRWTELTLYMVDESDTANWVVATIGASIVPGEVNRLDAIPCLYGDDLKRALTKGGKLTVPGYQLLHLGAEEDEMLHDYFMQHVQKVERL